jgi:hypothetical protein
VDFVVFLIIRFDEHFLSRLTRYLDELLDFCLPGEVRAVSALISFSVIFTVAGLFMEFRFGKSSEGAPNQDKGLF